VFLYPEAPRPAIDLLTPNALPSGLDSQPGASHIPLRQSAGEAMTSAAARLILISLLAAYPPGGAAASSAGRCGGTGGQHSKTLSCPSGQYVTGVFAKGGVYVDKVGISCKGAGGTTDFIYAGSSGGTNQDRGFCPDRYFVHQLALSSGVYVDQFSSFQCGGSFHDITLEIGGRGGDLCWISCPNGEELYQLTVRYGDWVDSIAGKCR
jgi:hypothetical protein